MGARPHAVCIQSQTADNIQVLAQIRCSLSMLSFPQGKKQERGIEEKQNKVGEGWGELP